jgi:hypothetical protein
MDTVIKYIFQLRIRTHFSIIPMLHKKIIIHTLHKKILIHILNLGTTHIISHINISTHHIHLPHTTIILVTHITNQKNICLKNYMIE